MKILAVYGADNSWRGRLFGLKEGFKMLCDVLVELGDEVAVADIAKLPSYNGENAEVAADVMAQARVADALIFASPAYLGGISSVLQNFLEYFDDPQYSELISGKNCLLFAISKNGGEREATNNLAYAINCLGAHDSVRLCLNQNMAYIGDESVVELIERLAEDFYRILRQNRRYFISPVVPLQIPSEAKAIEPIEASESPKVEKAPQKSDVNIEDLHKKHNLDNLNVAQQADIERISQMFAKKFVSQENTIEEDEPVPLSLDQVSIPSPKTCKQYTQSLPHYFNPHLASDVNAIVQLLITGGEGFEGYIKINGSHCSFSEGESPQNDIVVTADSGVWENVLKKRITAQKAFMMGQIKVRGNFMLLSKFDQMFNKIPS